MPKSSYLGAIYSLGLWLSMVFPYSGRKEKPENYEVRPFIIPLMYPKWIGRTPIRWPGGTAALRQGSAEGCDGEKRYGAPQGHKPLGKCSISGEKYVRAFMKQSAELPPPGRRLVLCQSTGSRLYVTYPLWVGEAGPQAIAGGQVRGRSKSPQTTIAPSSPPSPALRREKEPLDLPFA